MYLENEGTTGSKGSHWEKAILGNELMTAEASFLHAIFSEFSIALLKDTGFYDVQNYSPEFLYFGRGSGCDFASLAC